MGLKLYEETSVQAIADAIRAKNGSSDTYTISEMSTAIEDIPSGGGGGTHTETKTVTFLNTTTPFNVGNDFLSGYGVYPQDSSYALAIAVSDGVGFAARLHNGVVDGYSGSCTYSNGVFTFDSTFVLNYMGNSVYSLDCLFSNGDLYKYHWSNDRTICVREGFGEIKWFFKGYASPGQYARPKELARFFPPVKNTPILGPAYSTSDATEQVGWIGFYQNYIRTWSMNKATLISGNFYGVVNATDYYTEEQHEVYTDPLDIPDIDISLIEKTITANGTYSAEDDGYIGYSDVIINLPASRAFTGYNQIFKDSSMDVRFDLSGKFKAIWNGNERTAIGCTMQGHTNLIGTYNNINIKGNITDSCEYHYKYGYERTQFVVGVIGSDWQTAILVGYNDNGDVYKKEMITLTDQQVVNDIDIDIDLNELQQQGYQSAYLFISLLGISGEFEVTIT